jgi:hypothetical protein
MVQQREGGGGGGVQREGGGGPCEQAKMESGKCAVELRSGGRRRPMVKLALGGSLLLEVGPGLAANFNLKLKGPPGLADSDCLELALYWTWRWRPHCTMYAGCPSHCTAYKYSHQATARQDRAGGF